MNIRALALAALLAGCSPAKRPAVEDLRGREELSALQLGAIRGTRDGERLGVEAMFTGSAAPLTIQMTFVVGSPTTLRAGAWQWKHSKGTVAARSLTFLGGQDGPPSIGGTFDLLGPDGAPWYRVRIPVSVLKTRLP
jgi:hypothetical protein